MACGSSRSWPPVQNLYVRGSLPQLLHSCRAEVRNGGEDGGTVAAPPWSTALRFRPLLRILPPSRLATCTLCSARCRAHPGCVPIGRKK
eukprot:7757205-Pyramimonas_sp.AAC.2